MTPEREAELFADLKYLVKAVDQIRSTQEDHSKQIAHLEGKVDMMALWLQSTDQRFTAIMAPYQQRQAS